MRISPNLNRFICPAILITMAIACKTPKVTTENKEIVAEFLRDWSINPAPNNFDSVGVVFAIDPKGKMTMLGGLDLKTNSDSIKVPKEIDTVNTSFGVLANFLSLKNNDSIVNAGISDTNHVVTNFTVTSGIETEYDINTNIKVALKAKKDIILENQEIFDLKKSKIYLVVKTIKSANVDLSFQGDKTTSGGAFAKILQFLTITPHFNIRKKTDRAITYSGTQPLIIFYQLRYINMNILTPQGNQPKDVDLELGGTVSESSLYR